MNASQHSQHEEMEFNKVIVQTELTPIELFAMQIVVLPLVGNPHQTVPELEKTL
ncbi:MULTISPECIES: hypothetical protein [unclassified Bartonella]|uniref:hypothetical protein n=1 Tax=unclassified Bartonella TaxID=2645622 RepID=UPI002361D807|nr:MULTISPECIES: hypothetical protein [unclassified Bartonella]